MAVTVLLLPGISINVHLPFFQGFLEPDLRFLERIEFAEVRQFRITDSSGWGVERARLGRLGFSPTWRFIFPGGRHLFLGNTFFVDIITKYVYFLT